MHKSGQNVLQAKGHTQRGRGGVLGEETERKGEKEGETDRECAAVDAAAAENNKNYAK